MSENVIQMELVLTAEAEVTRACCGGNHEFGECPLDKTKKEDEVDDSRTQHVSSG
jgi:hypothetical protein